MVVVASSSAFVIVITGASGFLGQHLLRHLIDLGSSTLADGGPTTAQKSLLIYAIHHSKPELQEAVAAYMGQGRKSTNEDISCSVTVSVVGLDLTSREAIQQWVSTTFGAASDDDDDRPARGEGRGLPATAVDCCIHTAAMSSPVQCDRNPDGARAINVPRHLVELLPAQRWIVFSTDQVYDGDAPASVLYQETDNIVEPCKNVYGQTKLELERLFLHNDDQLKGRSAIILRSSIMLGPKTPFVPSHDTFLDFIASRAGVDDDDETTATPTTYYTNELRNVIAVQDVCRICAALMMMIQPITSSPGSTGSDDAVVVTGIYNLGGPCPVSRYDMAVAVLEYLGRDHCRLAVAATKSPSATTGDSTSTPLNLSMDCSKLRAALPPEVFIGGGPLQNLSEMVALTFANHSR